MRLFTFRTASGPRAGVAVEGSEFDLVAVLEAAGISGVSGVRGALDKFGAGLSYLERLVRSTSVPPLRADPDRVRLSPVPNPEKVFCVGLNYRDHVSETGRELPAWPDVFSKFARTLIGPEEDIACAQFTEQLDFEGELALVIGKEGHRIPVDEAASYIAGATVMNDVSARDYQHRGTQWILGKNLEASTPCGPDLVTCDEIGDLQNLELVTRLNGEEVQRSNTRHFIFGVAEIVSYLSQVTRLMPGDIIATGTPAGIGAKRTPPLWMRAGDTIEVEIEKIGRVRNVIRG